MNKLLFENYLKINTKIGYFLKRKFIWKNVLSKQGINNINMLTEIKKDEILSNVYNDLFKESQKDKRVILKGIGKTYENGFKAIHNFNLEVEPKEFVCLLGPSGCGKTTALRMVAGLETITEGKYLVGSQEMNSVHPSERNTAMVFQNYALYPFMTVYDNIAFGLKLKTYKNPVYKNLLKEYYDLYMPNHELIKDLKFKIFDLSHEKKNELNEKLIIRKKLSKEKKLEEVELINKEIAVLKNIYKTSRKRNAGVISETKHEITKLKNDQREKHKKIIEKENERISESKQKISDLKNEQEKYRLLKKNKIPELKADLKSKKSELKASEKSLNIELKRTYKMAKIGDDIKGIELGKKQVSSHEAAIENLGLEILELKERLNVIDRSKIFEINELKGKSSIRKSIKKDLLNSVVVWKKTIPTRVRKLSLLVGIRDYLKRKPAALSGGQRQRVALIRAISKNSQLFLFDEPLSNLDAKLRATMRSEIRKIHKSVGATSLYVTHDQIEAMTMADKVVVINLGYIQQVGSPKDLYENPSNVFVARFIGVPTINMFKAKLNVTKSTFSLNGNEMNYKLSPEKMKKIASSKEKEILVGIRPNDIKLSKGNKSGITGEVTNKELIGSEYVLELELNSNNTIRVLVPVHDKADIGDKFSVSFDPGKVSFFNIKTGDAISSIINTATRDALKVWKDSSEERIKNLKILGNDRNSEKLSKKAMNKIREGYDIDFKKTQLQRKIDAAQFKQGDYKVFDEDEITS